MLWVNDQHTSMRNLAMATTTPFNKAPTSINLKGDSSSVQSSTLSAKLCQKTGKKFFVSWNVSMGSNPLLVAEIERKIFQVCCT